MGKTNSAIVEDAAPAAADVIIPPFVAADNPTLDQSLNAIATAFDLVIAATTLNVNIPHADGDTEVEVVSDEQNGEVTTVRCRVANRFGRMQKGLCDALIRQLDFSVSSAMKEIDEIASDVEKALRGLAKSQDANKLLDWVDRKNDWADVLREQVGHATALRDKLADEYLAAFDRPYVPYEKREKQQLVIAAPAAGQAMDPRLERAKALIAGRTK